MTISINTSVYIKNKYVEIDGVPFTVRPMNTADTLALAALQRESTTKNSDQSEVLNKILDLYFNCFDKPDSARELLKNLSIDALMDIYQKIMAEGTD